MRKIKICVGEPFEVENRIVTKEEANRCFLRLRFKAEWGSVFVGNTSILEYCTLKEAATNEEGTTNIGYAGMSKGDRLDIAYIPFEKVLIGICEDFDVEITNLSLAKMHEWERGLGLLLGPEKTKGTDLRLFFENFEPKYDNIFLEQGDLPVLIIDASDYDIQPQKWFFHSLVFKTLKKTGKWIVAPEPGAEVNGMSLKIEGKVKHFSTMWYSK